MNKTEKILTKLARKFDSINERDCLMITRFEDISDGSIEFGVGLHRSGRESIVGEGSSIANAVLNLNYLVDEE
jgi:hypothetical protein